MRFNFISFALEEFVSLIKSCDGESKVALWTRHSLGDKHGISGSLNFC